MLAKTINAFNFSYESFCALYLDELTPRWRFSRRVKAEIRSKYFHSRAAIRDVSLGDFCAALNPPDPWQPIVVPALCAGDDQTVGSPQYFLALATIVAFLKPQSIVEFGTYLGASALTFMLNAPVAKLLTIDLPDEPGDISNLPPVDKDHVASSRNMIGKWYKGTAQEARIQQLQCDSRSLDLSKYVERADLVLIDGGHDVECVSADTKNAFKTIRPGGVVLWDDYFWLYPDVVEFLDEFSSTHELACIQGTNLVVHLCR